MGTSGYIDATESGFYYLNSRYYDPQTGRFLNADSYVSTGQGILGNNMFAYCLNNPINYVDSNGTNPEIAELWAGTMWWLCGVDSVLPFGDFIFGIGFVLLGIYELTEINTVPVYRVSLEKQEETEKDPPDVAYPGDDPTKAPEGTQWKGSGEQGSSRGNYYNPETGESWHPDLNHPEPIGPHWDYRDPDGIWWRVGKNTISPK